VSRKFGAETLRALDPTSDIIAHMHYGLGLRRNGKQVIKRDNAERFRRRNAEPPADVVHGAGRYPAKARLYGV
jgi:hypothetical protein